MCPSATSAYIWPIGPIPMTCTIRCGWSAHLDYRVCARPQRPPYWGPATCAVRCMWTCLLGLPGMCPSATSAHSWLIRMTCTIRCGWMACLDYQVCACPQRPSHFCSACWTLVTNHVGQRLNIVGGQTYIVHGLTSAQDHVPVVRRCGAQENDDADRELLLDRRCKTASGADYERSTETNACATCTT